MERRGEKKMRPTRTKKRFLRRVCACGCKESFIPARAWQKFKSPTHRKRAWTERNSLPDMLSKLNTRVKNIESRLKKIEGIRKS